MRLLLALLFAVLLVTISESAEVLDPQKLSVNSKFRCFSDSALCTCVSILGQGGFGVAWKVQVQLDASSLLTSQTPAAQLIRQMEPAVFREHKDLDMDGRRFFVAAKFQLEGCDNSNNCRNKGQNINNALAEITAWARMPPHPDVVDLLHVDIFGGCRLVVYSEYLEGAMNLEKALWFQAKTLMADGCSKSSEGGELITQQQFEEARTELSAITKGLINGYSDQEKTLALKVVSRCRRMGKKNMFQRFFEGRFFEPEVPVDAHTAEECAHNKRIHEAIRGHKPSDGICPVSNPTRCIELQAKIKSFKDQVADRALLLDRVAWQLASGLKHVHDNGITHFDVSPDNVIVTPGLDVYLTDFGTSHIKPQTMAASSGEHFLMPCEWHVQQECSLISDKSSSTPHCNTVDTYQLALTLTMLYSGYGLHEVIGNRDGVELPDKGNNFIYQPVKDMWSTRTKSNLPANCDLTRSKVVPMLVEDLPAVAYQNRSNPSLPQMSAAVQAAITRELSNNWRHRSGDPQKIIDAIEAPYGSKQNALIAMGLVNQGARVDASDEPGSAPSNKDLTKCKRGNLVAATAGYVEAAVATKMPQTLIKRARSLLYTASAVNSPESGCRDEFGWLANNLANDLYSQAFAVALQAVKKSKSELDKEEAKQLLEETMKAVKSRQDIVAQFEEALSIFKSTEPKVASPKTEISPQTVTEISSQTVTEISSQTLAERYRAIFQYLADVTGTQYDAIQAYCATAAYFTLWLWNKNRQPVGKTKEH